MALRWAALEGAPPGGQKGPQRSTCMRVSSQIEVSAHSFHHQLSKCLIPAWPGFENQHKTCALMLCLIAFILLQLAHRWQVLAGITKGGQPGHGGRWLLQLPGSPSGEMLRQPG